MRWNKKRFDNEALERISRLEALENVWDIEIQNKSYDEVIIETPIGETIIYLDPPYKNTWTYQKDIDHDKLNNWIKNSKYRIYLSSYESEFPCIAEFQHKSTLSATNNAKSVVEKLFTNIK
jgi:site-specific DNA-adenine methylase